MNQFKFLLIIVLAISLTSCSSTKTEIYWVSGFKSECDAGAAKKQCLNVSKGQNLDNADWQLFYSNIDGFKYEEGYLKKIEVKEGKLKSENVPADASSIKYTMVKELEKRPDPRILTQGDWILNRINSNPINRSIVLPKLNLNLTAMQLSGNGGCNNYSGQIKMITTENISLGNIASTKKACVNRNIEQEYFDALNEVTGYRIENSFLSLFDKKGNEKLSFMSHKEKNPNQRLNDIWAVKSIMGEDIGNPSSRPRIEINLTERKVFGNDGCNTYNGNIELLTENDIAFGQLASTRKMCPDMTIPDKYNKALSSTSSYKLDGLNLTFLDDKGIELLEFKKVD